MYGASGSDAMVGWWWWRWRGWLGGKITATKELGAIYAILALKGAVGNGVPIGTTRSKAASMETIDITVKRATVRMHIDAANAPFRTPVCEIGALFNRLNWWTVHIAGEHLS